MLSHKKNNDVVLAMIDLNNFKYVNDHYGHFAGDTVLKETARLLSIYFRKDDTIVRYGGDEFLLLIPIKDEETFVKKLVNRKLEAISSKLPYGCSLSFGISTGEIGTFDEILCQADKLMYTDKSRKKQKV